MSLDITPTDTRSGDFSWSIKGRIRTLDHGSTLASQDRFLDYMAMDAFEVIAFDPASHLQDNESLDGLEHFQHVPHALLGDGQMATLHACLDAEMSATLAPLPANQLPEAKRDGTQVLTQLPISTLALDSLDDVTAVDWLVLDGRHDNITLLDNSVQTMAETLAIQAHIPIIPIYQNQTSLGELCQWMAKHGFDCYRFTRVSHTGHLPADEDLERTQATQLASIEILFTAGEQRLANFSAEHLTKLAFLLDAVYGIHDYSYELLKRADPEQAKHYLISRGFVTGFYAEPDTFTLTAEYSPAPWATAQAG